MTLDHIDGCSYCSVCNFYVGSGVRTHACLCGAVPIEHPCEPCMRERDALRAKLDALREAAYLIAAADSGEEDYDAFQDALRGFLAVVEASKEVP